MSRRMKLKCFVGQPAWLQAGLRKIPALPAGPVRTICSRRPKVRTRIEELTLEQRSKSVRKAVLGMMGEKSGRFKMTEQIVRCPYCILDDQFRPMLQRSVWFICEQCGHTVIPEDPDFKCSCRECLVLKRAA
jgi:hypothetical protein